MLILALPMLVWHGTGRADVPSQFWLSRFTYLPSIAQTQGTAPLRARAVWTNRLSVLIDSARAGSYPWQRSIFVDWGDGSVTEVPHRRLASGISPNLLRYRWDPQQLVHVYKRAGTFRPRLRLGMGKNAVYTASITTVIVTRQRPARTGQASSMGAAAQGQAPAAAAAAAVAPTTTAAAACGDCARTRRFEIRYMAFVPANHLVSTSPLARCTTVDAGGAQAAPLVYEGDDRGFDVAAFARGSYRVAQRAVLVETVDTLGRSSFRLDVAETRVTPTRSYRAGQGRGSALTHGQAGKLDTTDRDAILGDCRLLHAVAADRTPGRPRPVLLRTEEKKAVLRLTGTVWHGLLPDDMPATSWNLLLAVDTSGSMPRVQASGTHSSFPAHELYVNGTPLLRDTPIKTKLPVPSLAADEPAPGVTSVVTVASARLLGR